MLDHPFATGTGWVAAQLSEMAALVEVTKIERDLLRHTPRAECFFPAITDDGLPSPLHPLSAYVFARATLPDPMLLTMERSRYIDAVLRAGRTVARIPDADLLRALKGKVREAKLTIGQPVMILAGDWSGIIGRVTQTRPDRVQVFVELRSTTALVKLATHEIEAL